MANYLVKVCPIRKGGVIIPVGGSVELADNETAGIEQFLELQIAVATGRPNVADTSALIQAAQTIEELNKLAEGEDRKTILPFIEKRRAELTAA